MALLTATVSSRITVDGTVPLPVMVTVRAVNAAGARVVLRSTTDAVTIAGKVTRTSAADGTLAVTLARLPQTGVTPTDARWLATFADPVTGRVLLPQIQFSLSGSTGWDDLVDLAGQAPPEPPPPGTSVIDIAFDTDGVPYLTALAGTTGSDFAFDTDGVPYLTAVAGTSVSEIAFDTDGVPYLIGV